MYLWRFCTYSILIIGNEVHGHTRSFVVVLIHANIRHHEVGVRMPRFVVGHFEHQATHLSGV
jgi:hypothetical protein